MGDFCITGKLHSREEKIVKGLVVRKAEVSNAIDIFALLKQAVKEKVYPIENPNDKQLQNFYFNLISNELPSPYHRYYLAKRGRGFLGMLHAIMVPGRWDGQVTSATIELLFVTKNRRKRGVAAKLMAEFKKDMDQLGIDKIDLLAVEPMVKYWEKQGAKKVTNFMRI